MKTRANLCAFQVSAQLVEQRLLGGDEESAPYLQVQGTFGAYKQRTRWSLTPTKRVRQRDRRRMRHALGADAAADPQQPQTYERDPAMVGQEFAAPARLFEVENEPGELRGGDAVHFELFCETRDFGVKEINERQSRYTFTHNTCGQAVLRLSELLQAYTNAGRPQRFVVERPLLDMKCVERKAQELRQLEHGGQISDERWNALVQEAAQLTSKGTLRFTVQFQHFHPQAFADSVFAIADLDQACLHATVGTALQESAASRLGAKPQQRQHHRKRLGAGLRGGHGGGETHSGDAYEPILFTSQKGQNCMMRALEQHVLLPYCRNYIKLQAHDPEPLHRPLNENVANLQLPMWVSKQGKLPVVAYWSSVFAATREYPNAELRARDLHRYGFDGRTERLLLQLVRSSLRRHGLGEARFQEVVNGHFSLKNRSTKLDPLFLVCEEAVADCGTFAANSSYYTADYRMVPLGRDLQSGKMVMLSLDSWDLTLLDDEGRGDDCEGMDHAAMGILRSYWLGRHELGAHWESPLLQSVQLMLKHTVLMDLGATVTSAYYDTSNNKPIKAQTELPLIDSELDRRAQCAGHCHGLWAPLGDTLRRLANGNMAGTAELARLEAAHPADEAYRARDAQRQVMVLEPTGSIEPRILPLEESYVICPALLRKKKAERAFVKALKARLQARKEAGGQDADLSDMFNAEGLQHYVEAQEPQRSVTSFYREPVHGTSVDLWKRAEGDLSLAQFSFGKREGDGRYSYGVKIADYLRHPEQYALVCPFYEQRERWTREVLPLIEAVQHQLPIASFGCYSDEQYAKLHSSYSEPGSLHAQYDFETPKPSSEAQSQFEQLAASVADDDDLCIIKLQSRDWALKRSDERTAAFDRLLGESPGLVAHAYFTEHQIPVCASIVEILVVGRVSALLAQA